MPMIVRTTTRLTRYLTTLLRSCAWRLRATLTREQQVISINATDTDEVQRIGVETLAEKARRPHLP